MPVEEQNASVNSNESLLDYSNAKDESESLLKDQPKENNLKMSFSPWSKLLNMYSKMKKSPIPKFHSKENSQELLKEDGQRIQLIVYRCNESNPLVFSHFRTTDSVGFVEMEIKKMLDVQNEVRLWKKGLNDETSLLQRFCCWRRRMCMKADLGTRTGILKNKSPFILHGTVNSSCKSPQ
ncbi:gametogenetin-binding protein 1-like isoform X2 [Rhincodon typus]|uniref:gametogenetin-binding protein 1-like isoform X2 n=1 Tax=Rhincodon typus TaxID=259920 RepID=UPI00202DC63A|nr:gametogenetin-binding protein 1-like isoform X2 [Rhincodon typus]